MFNRRRRFRQIIFFLKRKRKLDNTLNSIGTNLEKFGHQLERYGELLEEFAQGQERLKKELDETMMLTSQIQDILKSRYSIK